MSTHLADTAGSPTIETTTWRIDPARSTVEFRAKTLWGIATVRGRFSRYQGTLDLSRTPSIELTIEAASLDSKNPRRDQHLRSPDFFGAERHPEVRFVSESAEIAGDRLRVRGRLHARGASMPLDVDATLRRVGDELEIDAVTIADHRQLGMTWNPLGALPGPSELIVRGRLVRDA